MKLRLFGLFLISGCVFALCVSRPISVSRADSQAHELAKRYEQFPLRFEKNEGQAAPDTRFVARGTHYAVALQPQRALLQFPAPRTQTKLELHWLNADPRAAIKGADELPTRTHYLQGPQARHWRTDIHNYGSVIYEQLYPGIDLVWYGNGQQLEYDFRLAPHARPERIQLAWRGAECVRVEASGDLAIEAQGQTLRMRKPQAWQIVAGEKRTVACEYQLQGTQGVTFALGAYDATQPLVIDPMVVSPALLYALPINGNNQDTPGAVAVDAAGNAYVTGSTMSLDLASANAAQPNYGGGTTDAFVAKLDGRGARVLYVTYLGGRQSDYGTGIAVDAAGNAYVTGWTESPDFPVTTGALQTTKRFGSDAFVVKLNAAGDRLSYATLLGGENADFATDIALNAAGQAVITGSTNSYQLRAGRESVAGLYQTKAGVPLRLSTDRGATFTPRSQGLTAAHVTAVAVNPQNQQSLLLSASEGLFRSLDGGVTWQTIAHQDSTAPWPRGASELHFDPNSPRTVYALASLGLYKSTDEGQTWTIKAGGGLFGSPSDYTTLAVSPNRAGTLYLGVAQRLYQSSDGGDTWQVRWDAFSTESASRIRALALHPTDSNLLYAVTNAGLFRSTNGGVQWDGIARGVGIGIVNREALSTIAIDPVTPSTLYLGGINNVAVYKSVDNGLNWTPQSAGLEGDAVNGAVPISKMLVEPANRATVYALSQRHQLYRSLNGGAQWTLVNGLENTEVTTFALDRSDPGKLYVGARSGADGFVAQLNAEGTALRWLSYFGGTSAELVTACALDPAGNVYVTGVTNSRDFPALTKLPQVTEDGLFVLKFAADGARLLYAKQWSHAYPSDLAVSNAGQAVIAGYTDRDNLLTRNPIQATRAGGVDGFVARLNAEATEVDFATYLGGSSDDYLRAVAVDNLADAAIRGAIVVVGGTNSANFPTREALTFPNMQGSEAFLARLQPASDGLRFSTRFGGIQFDEATAVALDAIGNAVVTGFTASENFPFLPPTTFTGNGTSSVFVTKFGTEIDLALSLTPDRPIAQRGNTLTYAGNVTNLGPSTATAVRFAGTLPAGVTLASATASQGSCMANGSEVVCTLGDLAAQRTANFRLTVNLAASLANDTTLNYLARVSAAEPELRTTNNQATATTLITQAPTLFGRITDPQGNPLSGVAVALTGSLTASRTTNDQGFYQFANLPSGGNFTVTPTRTGYSLEPAARTFNNLTSEQAANFVATTCSYVLTPAQQSISSLGGSLTVNVTAPPRCPWRATSQAPWLTVTGNAAGSGNAAISLSATASTAPRAGRITVADQSAAIYQAVEACATLRWRQATPLYNATPTAFADFNGDGLDELLITSGTSRISHAPFALLSYDEASGGLRKAAEFTHTAPEGFFAPLAGDFNGDRKLDLAFLQPERVLFYYNDGQGRFLSALTISATLRAFESFAADLNKDGRDDLLHYDGREVLGILLSQPNGAWSNLIRLRIRNILAVADFTGDQIPDVLSVSDSSSSPTHFLIYPGDGAGSFLPPAPLYHAVPAGFTFLKQAAQDVNADGNLDLLALFINQQQERRLQVWLGRSDGSFELPWLYPHALPRLGFGRLAVGDVNNDARPDVILNGAEGIWLLPGEGTGQFSPAARLNDLPLVGEIRLMRLNRDLALDVLITNNDGLALISQVWFNECGNDRPKLSGIVHESESFGNVRREWAGVSGITLRLAGGLTATRTSDVGGYYEFLNLPRANYQLTPISPGRSFTPPRADFTDLNADQAQNFLIRRLATAVSSASYAAGAIAPDSIASLFGVELATGTQAASTSPLPFVLANASVSVGNDATNQQPARLFFASPAQINFHVPAPLAVGTGRIEVSGFAQYPPYRHFSDIRLERVVPGLFTLNATGRGLAAAVALRVRADGSQVYESIARYDAQRNDFVALPLDVSNANEQVFLILFGTGFRNRLSLNDVNVALAGQTLPAAYAGAQGDLTGLDQLNVRLPASLRGRGEVTLTLNVEGKSSNAVTVNIR